MRKLSLLIAFVLVVMVAPASFACVICDYDQGCLPQQPDGYQGCREDPTFICINLGGFCGGGLRAAPLATHYRVAAVHVVPAAQPVTVMRVASAPQRAAVAVASASIRPAAHR